MIDVTKLSPAQPDGGVSSFANLLMMILGFDETEKGFSYADYLTCIGLAPGSAPRPTHPFYFPLGFPEEGPPAILRGEVAERMEEAFAELRGIHGRLAENGGTEGLSTGAVDELGQRAMVAVRQLGAALGSRRWDSGETMVRMMQLAQVLRSSEIDGAELVQAINERGGDCFVWENPQESNNKVRVPALRLIFQLASSESIEGATPAKLTEWRLRSLRIAAVHNALFPGDHCIVEFRDHSAATLTRSKPIGPSYAEVVAKRNERRSAPVPAEQREP